MRASICREAGATVAANVLFRDLNIMTARHDDRRIEVIANFFFPDRPFCKHPGAVPVQQTTGVNQIPRPNFKPSRAGKQAHPMREVSGGASDESARRSLKKEPRHQGVGDGKGEQAFSKGACGSYGKTRAVAAALRSAPRGCAPGLPGRRAEHRKLQEGEAIELLAEACALLAQACVPTKECKALAMARLTALRKPDGGVRGIATGDTFRRLVSKTFAREWVAKFDQATRPFQLALQARAGTDALAAHVRAALETRPGAVLVSLDGRRAYDSMSRASFLGKLREVAPELLPFVHFFLRWPLHVLLVGGSVALPGRLGRPRHCVPLGSTMPSSSLLGRPLCDHVAIPRESRL